MIPVHVLVQGDLLAVTMSGPTSRAQLHDTKVQEEGRLTLLRASASGAALTAASTFFLKFAYLSLYDCKALLTIPHCT